jgi:hypothetical protein
LTHDKEHQDKPEPLHAAQISQFISPKVESHILNKYINRFDIPRLKPQYVCAIIIFGNNFIVPSVDALEEALVETTPWVVVPSGSLNEDGKFEAGEMVQHIMSKNIIQRSRILPEGGAQSTLDNIIYSLREIKERLGIEQVDSIMAIAHFIHMPRVLRTIARQAPDARIYPFSYETSDLTKDNWYKSDAGWEFVIDEDSKLMHYETDLARYRYNNDRRCYVSSLANK